MVKERVYPISDYYTSLVKFPLPNMNDTEKPKNRSNPPPSSKSSFSPASNNSTLNSFSPAPSPGFSPASSPGFSPASINDINLLMTPGLLRTNLNNSWMSSPKTPSHDYEPLPPDLGSFNNFN